MISEHVTEWLGFPVQLLNAENAEEGVSDYGKTIYRLATEYDNEMGISDLMERFTSDPACVETPAIIIGAYAGDDSGVSSEETVQLLVAARTKLPKLTGIFLGDILSEENEISWIIQSDVSALFSAYPKLEHFRVRGTEGLSFGGGLRHEALKSLVVESGGLPPPLLQEILSSDLPSLEHLEIWLGDPGYGGDTTIEDLKPILNGSKWPKLKHLGLRNHHQADALAAALKGAPVLAQLETLDLSLGTLGNTGAAELLENPALKNLQFLDLHHHYLSAEMQEKVAETFQKVNLDDAEDEADEDDRYVAVSE